MADKEEDPEVINTPAADLYDKDEVRLPRSLFLLDVQAAFYFLTHPSYRRMIIELTKESHSATSLADLLGVERSHLSKRIQKVAQCGIIREIPKTETPNVGNSKFYVADKDVVKLCATFANEYIKLANIEGLHEEISAAKSAKRSYTRRM